MKIGVAMLALGAGLAGAAVAQGGQTIPPISVVPAPPANTGLVIDFVAGQVQCDGGSATAVRVERPFPVWAIGLAGARTRPVDLTFRIDAVGRPLGIARVEQQGFTGPQLFHSSEDVLPAFAAWRFAGGNPQTGCRIRFDAVAVPVTQAPASLLRRYYVSPHRRSDDAAIVFRRIHAPNTNCIETGVPQVRMRAFPAFENIPQAPGTWSYSMTEFDIDRRGKPVRVRLLESGGNPVLDQESLAAVRKSRFAPAARQGCTYPYYRASTTAMTAPPSPDQAAFRPKDAQCPETALTFSMPLRFPAGFDRRRIEGWAIIGYDVAPWGETGNVRVLAAEPAAAFGERAQQVIRSGRQAAAGTGRTGCVDIVRFVMPKEVGPVGEGA
jgi:TonB family protein